jgi:hypothetical protein
MTDAERQAAQDRLLLADVLLKTRQGFWETPRNIAVIVGTAVAPQQIIVHLDR